jgi:hypothetical protein
MSTKNNFLNTFYWLLLFEDTFISFFKDKNSKRIHKTVEIKVFLTILLDDRRIGFGNNVIPLFVWKRFISTDEDYPGLFLTS